MEEEKQPIVTIDLNEYEVGESMAKKIADIFNPMVATLEEFEESYTKVMEEATEEVTPEVAKKARLVRLGVRRVRLDAEAARKKQKAFYLQTGRAIDGVANIFKAAVDERESNLLGIEKYIENQEAERIEGIHSKRCAMLAEFGKDVKIPLGEMDDDVWENFYAAQKKTYEDRIQQEKEAEEAAAKAEKERREEAERLREENARLREEKEAAERLADEAEEHRKEADREKAEYEAAVAKKAADLKAREESEAKALTEAPDREKIEHFCEAIEAVAVPQMDTEGGRDVALKMIARLNEARQIGWEFHSAS